MPIGSFNPIASTAALFNNMAEESEGVPEKSFPFKILIPIVFEKSISVAIPDMIISPSAGFPSQSGADDFHHISVMGEEVWVTELINPVFCNSCFIMEKFFLISDDEGTMIRLSGL